MKLLVPLFIFFSSLLYGQTYCLFTPPPNWEIADPKMVSKRAIFGFLDKSKSGFCPSINLTSEKVSLSPEEYLLIVEENCKKKRQKWRHLGKIQTRAGVAELTEVEVRTQFGAARMMQAILFKEGTAYILTAGALKKDFSKHASLIEQAFSSLTLSDDLFSLVENEKLQEKLRTSWQKKEVGLESKTFETLVLKECCSLGAPWQILMLKL